MNAFCFLNIESFLRLQIHHIHEANLSCHAPSTPRWSFFMFQSNQPSKGISFVSLHTFSSNMWGHMFLFMLQKRKIWSRPSTSSEKWWWWGFVVIPLMCLSWFVKILPWQRVHIRILALWGTFSFQILAHNSLVMVSVLTIFVTF